MTDPSWAEKVERMREASAHVTSDNPLVILLYSLARDEIPSGVIDSIIDRQPVQRVAFTNGWLAEWAKDAANRLTVVHPSFTAESPMFKAIIRGETESIVGGAGTPPKRRWWNRKKAEDNNKEWRDDWTNPKAGLPMKDSG